MDFVVGGAEFRGMAVTAAAALMMVRRAETRIVTGSSCTLSGREKESEDGLELVMRQRGVERRAASLHFMLPLSFRCRLLLGRVQSEPPVRFSGIGAAKQGAGA